MTAGGAGLPLWPHPLCLGVVWRPHSPRAPNSHQLQPLVLPQPSQT